MLKELLLKKGWAGKTISRQETIERLNPIIQKFIRLNYTYDAVERSAQDSDLSRGIRELQKTARADVGKLAETVFSCGGTAYNGTDLEPGRFKVPHEDVEAIQELLGLEQDFKRIVESEGGAEHQMRTRAILSVVKDNSDKRLAFLRAMNSQLRKA